MSILLGHGAGCVREREANRDQPDSYRSFRSFWRFDVLELPVGHYRLQVEAKGFQTYVQQGITLDVNEKATIPVRLAVGLETSMSTCRPTRNSFKAR